jgi:hypothetical protein
MGNHRRASSHSACSLSLRLSHCASNSGRLCSDNSIISFKTLRAGEPRTISIMSEASIKKWTLTSHSPRRLAWKWGGSWSLDQNQSFSPKMEKALIIATVTLFSYRTFVKWDLIFCPVAIPIRNRSPGSSRRTTRRPFKCFIALGFLCPLSVRRGGKTTQAISPISCW